MKKMCKECLHYEHCINIPNYPVTDHTLGCDDWERDIRNKLKEYEDLEEQGLLLRLPCKVGDKIYEIVDGEIKEYSFYHMWKIARYLEAGLFGEWVFLTREEAEARLKELETPKELCGATGLECIHCNAGACDNRRLSK